MKHLILFTLLCLITTSFFGQNKFREQMIESGEKQLPVEVQTFGSDYLSFLKSRAWNSKTSNTGALTNVSELDMPNIGGRVRASLVDKDNNIALVAPSGGGIWKFDATNENGFQPINDFGSFLPVTDIAQDPNAPNHILIATGDEIHGVPGNGVFTSSNSGNSFSPLAGASPSDNSDFNYIRFVKFAPGSSSILYLTSRSKLYKSTDSGANWTLVFEGSDDLRSLDFLTGNGVIVSVENEGLYSSTTGNNNSFSSITNGLPTTTDGNLVVSFPPNRLILYSFFVNDNTGIGEIYKSINGGSVWSKQGDVSFSSGQSWFALALGVHPTDQDKLIAGSIGWGYSKDGGVTWKNGGDLEVDYHSVHFHSSNPDVAYVGYDQGIGSVDFSQEELQWEHNGTQWVQALQPRQVELGKQPGFNTSQIYYGDFLLEEYGDSYLMGQQDGGSFAIINGNARRVIVGDGCSVSISKQGGKKAFASTQRGNIVVTQDVSVFDSSYNRVGDVRNDHPNFITSFAGNTMDENQVYIPSNTAIKRSLDFGATFDSIAPHALTGVKIACSNELNPMVYAIGYDRSNGWQSDLIIIQNASSSSPTVTNYDGILSYWTEGTPDRINVDPNDPYTVYITGNRGAAIKVSALNTATPIKTEIRGDIPDVVFNIVVGIPNEPEVLFAGTNIGLFVSTDTGTTWTLNNEIPYTQVTDIRYRTTDKRLFIFTYGRGAWAGTLAPEIVGTASKEINNSFEIFPNPASNVINLDLSNYDTESLNLIIYDVNGTAVMKASPENIISVSELDAGFYIVHLMKDEEIIGIQKFSIKN